MKRHLAILFSLIFALGSVAFGQKHSDVVVDSLEKDLRLDDLISRFNDDNDTTLKCRVALEAFKEEFEKNRKDALSALYVGRAFDHIASIGRVCDVSDDDFLRFSDSACHYYRLAEKLQPSIKDKAHGFPVPVMIGHIYGTRCLWRMKRGEYENARKELVTGMKEGGFSPAQVELCRLMLDFCDSGSVLFPVGDDDTFPMMYLQVVEGYRADVTVINSSLGNMGWYVNLFREKGHNGFAPVQMLLSKQEVDSLDGTNSISYPTVPDRLYTEVDGTTSKRIHNELGIDVAEKAEMCFPVYQMYGGGYYVLAIQKVIASILLANKWKRRVFFAWGGLQGVLNCDHVAMRDGILLQELYPINLGQADHFKKGDRWFHEEKLKRILLHDARMEKFSEKQVCTNSQVMMYYTLSFYLTSLDSNDNSRKEVIRRIQSIPHECLAGSEETVLGCAQQMYRAGFREEAKRECEFILPNLKKALSGSKTSMGQVEANYIVGLMVSGRCRQAIEFVNSFEVSQSVKDGTLHQMEEFFGCK